MSRQNVGSLIDDTNSTDDLTPQQLSGDQNAQKSLLMSQIMGTKANFLLSVTTIMKTVIGAGILSLPLTVSRLGYVLSLIVFVIVIAIIQFSCVLLLKAKNLSKHSNYSSIAYHIFRTKLAQAACSLMILLNNTGICIAELLIIKGAVGKILDGYVTDIDIRQKFYCSALFIVLVCAALQCPLTLVNKIQKLKIFAFIGVSGITIFVITLIIAFFILISDETSRNWQCSQDMVPVAHDFLQMIIVIPNMMLALAYSMNFFPIFKGMKDARDQKMSKASLTGICACSVFYLLVGNMGYCLFGNNLKGNFLVSFSRGDINQALYIILNISFLISVFLSFPIMFFGARNNFIAITNNIIARYKNKQNKQINSSDNVEQVSSYIQTQDRMKRKKQAKFLFVIYTIILFAFIIAIAAAVDDIEDVFNVVGAIASNAINFIFPAMFYMFLIRKKNKARKIQYYISIGLFCFFIPFGIFSVISKFLKNQQI